MIDFLPPYFSKLISRKILSDNFFYFSTLKMKTPTIQNLPFFSFQHHHPSLYDDSFYRLLPSSGDPCGAHLATATSPTSMASAALMSDEELHREYAVVLDALNHSCCLAAAHAQITSESPGIHTSGKKFCQIWPYLAKFWSIFGTFGPILAQCGLLEKL